MKRTSAMVTDLGVRAAGALLVALAVLAIAALHALHRARVAAGPGDIALAAAAFLGASAGGVALMQGRHLFDRIVVGRRWWRY